MAGEQFVEKAIGRRLAMKNLAVRGLDVDLGKEDADPLRRDPHKDLKAVRYSNPLGTARRHFPCRREFSDGLT
jgi:hypothetical protein